ncbi:MAG TPA: hypothetical protein VMU66_05650 [Gaiellales bacterium]|nr:hypothetical protein [Gaiellales bacterium]
MATLDSRKWEITAQREDYRPGPTGAFVAGVVVTFRLPSGTTGSVFIPDSQYSAEIVRAAIAARAAVMEAVNTLTGA